MKVALKIFAQMSAGSYTNSVLGLIKKGPEQVEYFKQLCANAIARTIETNDVIHINRMVEAAVACGRYRTFARVVPGLVPFAYDKAERVFSGKRQPGKYDKLVALDENGSHHFENLLVEYFEKEDVFGKQTPPKDWSLDDLNAAVLRLVKTAHRKGFNDNQIEQAVELAEKSAAS